MALHPSVRLPVAAALATAILGLVAGPAQAGTVLVTRASDLGANDEVDWGQLGADGTVVNPYFFEAGSDAGLVVFGSSLQAAPPSLTVLTQGVSFSGTFAADERLLSTGDGSGPLTFGFLTPVSAAGAQIQRNLYGSFIAQISAFDAEGNPLQSQTYDYQEAGYSFSTGDPPIFLGISSSSADIAKIEIQVLPSTGIASTSFVIDSLLLDNPAAPVPEPQRWALWLGGLLTLASLRAVQRRS
jgi:hypothetical protein